MKQNLMYSSLLLSLVLLAAFRPWSPIADAIGVKPLPEVTETLPDSLFPDDVAVVLPESVVDTLAERLSKNQRAKSHFESRLADLDSELPKLKEKIEKRQRHIAKLEKELVEYNDIERLLEAQKKTPVLAVPSRSPAPTKPGLLRGTSDGYRMRDSDTPGSRYASRRSRQADSATAD